VSEKHLFVKGYVFANSRSTAAHKHLPNDACSVNPKFVPFLVKYPGFMTAVKKLAPQIWERFLKRLRG
jgi:hypothetical protein